MGQDGAKMGQAGTKMSAWSSEKRRARRGIGGSPEPGGRGGALSLEGVGEPRARRTDRPPDQLYIQTPDQQHHCGIILDSSDMR